MTPKHQIGRQFTQRDVQRMISNQVYAGVGIYPAMVPEDGLALRIYQPANSVSQSTKAIPVLLVAGQG